MSDKIYIVPIEPIESRYTEQWYRHFPKAFKEAGYQVEVIDGTPLSKTIGVGTFLDINSTIHYKNTQMATISELFHTGKVEPNSVFFFLDIEFWGVESLRLMSDMNNVPVKIFGFLHAASHTKEDAFAIAEPYQKYTEIGWYKACDAIFVGSGYHKNAVYERRLKPYSDDPQGILKKFEVTGNPIFIDEYKPFDVEKKKQIVISNRFDWEKRPNMSLDLALVAKSRHPDLSIVVTTSAPKFRSNKKWLSDYARYLEKSGQITILEGLSKDDYHRVLAESKIMLSNSIEESFGYCIAEACVYNTYPLLKNELSHPELVKYDSRLLFNDEDEVQDKIDFLLESSFDVKQYAEQYTTAIKKMVSHISYLKFPF